MGSASRIEVSRPVRIALQDPAAATIDHLASDDVRYDYVYAYPPRQAYEPFAHEPFDAVHRSLTGSDELNLYVHVPFCAQICGFCNLFSVAESSESTHADYCATVLTEMRQRALPHRPARVPTIYIGGGTPSLLDASHIARLLDGAAAFAGVDLGTVEEVAIEVDPATTSPRHIRDLAAAGINRINLGYQSTDAQEVLQIGRRSARQGPTALQVAADEAGIENVCIDLIYGLPGQTDRSWARSLAEVIDAAPQTICAYVLTHRPHTGFARTGRRGVAARETYRLYDMAREALGAAGYRQESNVRWTRVAHGYLQKSLHWKSQNILGFGAGARSYLRHVDLRNGYSVRHRRRAVAEHRVRVDAGTSPVTDGLLLTTDERMRKAMILGLGLVSASDFADEFGQGMGDVFGRELELLEAAGLIAIAGDDVTYTARGLRHRDSAVQIFFSPSVRARIASFDYDE